MINGEYKDHIGFIQHLTQKDVQQSQTWWWACSPCDGQLKHDDRHEDEDQHADDHHTDDDQPRHADYWKDDDQHKHAHD